MVLYYKFSKIKTLEEYKKGFNRRVLLAFVFCIAMVIVILLTGISLPILFLVVLSIGFGNFLWFIEYFFKFRKNNYSDFLEKEELT